MYCMIKSIYYYLTLTHYFLILSIPPHIHVADNNDCSFMLKEVNYIHTDKKDSLSDKIFTVPKTIDFFFM